MNTVKKLFTEVNQLHQANIANAMKTAENAIQIGVDLHQIKEQVGHGEFLPAMAEHAKAITPRCCQNYMRLATERLIEEKARLLITDGKSATVADLTHDGKCETVSHLEDPAKSATVADLPALPENALSAEAVDQARKEVEEMSWVKIPAKLQQALVKNIRGKDLMELYRDYGIVREKEPKVYHPAKPQTPDEKIQAENEQAAALVTAALNGINILLIDLGSQTGTLALRVKPAQWKELSRSMIDLNKKIKPLAKRKASKAQPLPVELKQ